MAGAPPAVDGAGAELPVAEAAGDEAAVGAQLAGVFAVVGVGVAGLDAGGVAAAGEGHRRRTVHLAGGLGAEVSEQGLFIGAAEGDGGGAGFGFGAVQGGTQVGGVLAGAAGVAGAAQAFGHRRPIHRPGGGEAVEAAQRGKRFQMMPGAQVPGLRPGGGGGRRADA